MATQKAISANTVINNGGAAMNAGSNLSGGKSVLTERLSPGSTNLGVFGSTVVQNVNNASALTSGAFAKMNPIIGKKVSISFAKVSNNALLSGAADPVRRRSIARLEAVRTTLWSTGFRANKFSLYTGKFEAGYPQVSVDDAMVVNGGVYQDQAASPTRAVPGELVYKTGAKVPVMDNYKPKNG